jgi:GLPGLI family protein
MKYLIIIILFFLYFTKKSNQNIKVTKIEYIETKRQDSINVSWQGSYYLYSTGSLSKYYLGQKLKTNSDSETENIEFKPKNSKPEVVFKDYIKNEMFSKDLIGFKFLTIKDSINIIKWNIKNKKQKILGYTCTLAESFFRGRTYQAWFTSQLIAGGPWKLDGLPGLILKADTKDGYMSFEATKIIIAEQEIDKIDLANPYSLEKKYYSWEEFKKKYYKKAVRMSKFNPNDNTSFVLPYIRRERYINENDWSHLKNDEIKKSIERTKS